MSLTKANNDDFFAFRNGEEVVAVDTLNGIEFVRTSQGWYYRDSELPVPGADDRTLANEYKPRFVGVPDQEPEQVLIAAEMVDKHPEVLGWCKEVGALVRNGARGKVSAYLVPYEEWQVHAAKPLGIIAPEFSSDEWEAELASAERAYRMARQEFDAASSRRQSALEAAIASGLSRARAAEILDVSAGRVTQLLKPSAAPTSGPKSKKLKLNEAMILALIGASQAPVSAAAIAEAGQGIVVITSKESTAQVQLASLASRGWVEGSPSEGYTLAPKGARWFEAQGEAIEETLGQSKVKPKSLSLEEPEA